MPAILEIEIVTQATDLSAVSMNITANAGDDISLPFSVVGTDTTGWTLACVLYNANSNNTGPDGNASIGSATIVNTPGTPNSSIVLSIAGSLTASRQNKSIFGALKKTNTNAVRTFTGMIFSII